MTTADLVTAGIALAALALSLINTVFTIRQQLRERREKLRRHLVVEASVYRSGADPEQIHSLEIKVTNQSPEVEITVVDIYAGFPVLPMSLRNSVQGERKLPLRLPPGDRVEFSLPWKHLSDVVPTPDEDGRVRFPIGVREAWEDRAYEDIVSYPQYLAPLNGEDE